MILLFDYEFSSAHFYEQKKWSARKNHLIFGQCYTPYGHGHNYRLQLEVDIGTATPILAKAEIDTILKATVAQLDHQHLNFVIPFFKKTIPTTENISLYLQEQIRLPLRFQVKLLRLFEMNSIFVELKV
ncbi:MAG: 6-carboxytetrahydropterin synthase [Bdellovibrionaceae bacterium]|nr:6-carboxytetrahydropterin synthase [Pseudobdellovibrionaceae bacterium]